eukprot:Amastigsp_a342239_6.p3 type:complete len:111 gc:universal Amastigsp_a342239_6:1108-776(-)
MLLRLGLLNAIPPQFPWGPRRTPLFSRTGTLCLSMRPAGMTPPRLALTALAVPETSAPRSGARLLSPRAPALSRRLSLFALEPMPGRSTHDLHLVEATKSLSQRRAATRV